MNTYQIRLDAHPTDHYVSATRLALLEEELDSVCVRFLLVEELKASGQVHWQAVIWTTKEAQYFRDILREELELKKNMYSCTIARKPEGFERYLCKGPTGKHKETPNVIASRGEIYSPGYFVQCHEEWHANAGKAKRPRKAKDKGFQEKCYDELVAMQMAGQLITPFIVRSVVWAGAQAGFKTYMPAMMHRIVVLIWCRFDEQADRVAQERIDIAVQEELNLPHVVGGYRTPQTFGNVYAIPEEESPGVISAICAPEEGSADCPSNCPLDSGTGVKISQEDYDDQAAEDEGPGGDLCGFVIHPEDSELRDCSSQDIEAGLEAARCESPNDAVGLAELRSVRFSDWDAGLVQLPRGRRVVQHSGASV